MAACKIVTGSASSSRMCVRKRIASSVLGRPDGRSPNTQTVDGWPFDTSAKRLDYPPPPPQPSISQGLQVPGVAGVLGKHRLTAVAVFLGLFSPSWIQVLRQHDGEQVQVVRIAR